MDPTTSDDKSDFCFFDLETTFPEPPDQRRVILEFGAILVCPRRLVELRDKNYSSLVRPDDPSSISPDFARSNGITRDAILAAPSFSEIADEVYDFLHGRIWVGHNIEEFDSVIIREAFEKIGRRPPEHKGMIDSLTWLSETFGRRAGDLRMATLANYFEIGRQTHRSLDDVRMNLEVIKHCAAVMYLESNLPEMLTADGAGFLKLDEVSLDSISASLIPNYHGTQNQIKLLHRDVALQLYCPCLRVRYGIRPMYIDQAGRPRLSFVVDAPSSLCRVLNECDNVAEEISEYYGSNSEWRPVVAGDSRYITVRLHIRTKVNGDTAQYDTEIHQKDIYGTVRKLVFSNFDAEELGNLFREGIFVDAFFSLDTYDYRQRAGILLVAKKLVVHSDRSRKVT